MILQIIMDSSKQNIYARLSNYGIEIIIFKDPDPITGDNALYIHMTDLCKSAFVIGVRIDIWDLVDFIKYEGSLLYTFIKDSELWT